MGLLGDLEFLILVAVLLVVILPLTAIIMVFLQRGRLKRLDAQFHQLNQSLAGMRERTKMAS